MNTAARIKSYLKHKTWDDVQDELFGKPGTKRRAKHDAAMDKIQKRREREVAQAKANGEWPSVGDIYYDVRDEELHEVIGTSDHGIYTYYGSDIISSCLHIGPFPPDYVYIGKL